MAPLFRLRRRSPEGEAGGSGGKALRRRRATGFTTPYQRPRPPTSSPSPAPALPSPSQPRNPSWLSGLISGAGKLISSVFVSDSSSPSSASDCASDDGNISANEGIDIDSSSEELLERNQGGIERTLGRNFMQASSATIPKSDSKVAIEQLLMQETFSRDECEKLTEILQSRVIDYASAAVHEGGPIKEILPYPVSSATSHYLHHLSALSPRLSTLHSHTTDFHATAVKEAKEWLEDKKLGSVSNTNLDFGPCTLNTDMLNYDTESEAGSPVDMAKSYMSSLPPWRSPSLNGSGFKSPLFGGKLAYRDVTSYKTVSYSLPKKKLREPFWSMEQVDSFSVPNDSLILASSTMKRHDRDSSSETKITPPKEIKSADPSEIEADNDHRDCPSIQTVGGDEERVQTNKLAITCLVERHTIAGKADASGPTEEESNGRRDRVVANGPPADLGKKIRTSPRRHGKKTVVRSKRGRLR